MITVLTVLVVCAFLALTLGHVGSNDKEFQQ